MHKNNSPQVFPIMAGATKTDHHVDGGNFYVTETARAKRLNQIIAVTLVISFPAGIGAFMCIVPLFTQGQSMLSGNLMLGCILAPVTAGLLLTAAIARIIR